MAAYPGRLQAPDLFAGVPRGNQHHAVGRIADDGMPGPVSYQIPGLHRVPRVPSPPAAMRGRIMVAAFAVGAAAAAGAAYSSHPTTVTADGAGDGATGQTGIGGDAPASPDVMLAAQTVDPSVEAAKLAEGQQILAARQAAAVVADQPRFVAPTVGRLTSGFAPRWGTFHYGIDIANVKDTPIVAVASGTIIDAGPAHGFGLWVRERLSDGTILVYGHMDSFSVQVGQRVKAGDQIALMGNRGEATGYHLHFEVWNPAGKKVDPVPWLNARGVAV